MQSSSVYCYIYVNMFSSNYYVSDAVRRYQELMNLIVSNSFKVKLTVFRYQQDLAFLNTSSSFYTTATNNSDLANDS